MINLYHSCFLSKDLNHLKYSVCLYLFLNITFIKTGLVAVHKVTLKMNCSYSYCSIDVHQVCQGWLIKNLVRFTFINNGVGQEVPQPHHMSLRNFYLPVNKVVCDEFSLVDIKTFKAPILRTVFYSNSCQQQPELLNVAD